MGTSSKESKIMFIFSVLIMIGSLVTLYQTYNLLDDLYNVLPGIIQNQEKVFIIDLPSGERLYIDSHGNSYLDGNPTKNDSPPKQEKQNSLEETSPYST